MNTSPQKISAPEVRCYLSAAEYLQDYFSYRHFLEPSFSYEKWAHELGFKSRTYIRLLCQNKRHLTSNFIEKFSQKAHLDNIEKEHLIILSLHAQASEPEYKKIYLSKAMASYSKKEFSIDEECYSDFLSSVHLPLIHILLAVKNMQLNDIRLATLLKIDLDAIRSNLETLERIGLITNEDGYWHARQKSFKITDNKKSEALAMYNRATVKECEALILEQNITKRFRSIFFAFNESQISEVDHEIEKFLAYLKNKFNCPQSKTDRYFKLNLQLYPVTETLDVVDQTTPPNL